MTKQEKQKFQYELRKLLTENTKNDEELFLKILCANDIINVELQQFNDIFLDK